MTDRTRRLRQESLEAVPSLSAERALLVTAFYEEHLGLCADTKTEAFERIIPVKLLPGYWVWERANCALGEM